MFELTAFQRDILYAIAGLEDPTGTDIKADLDSYYEDEVYHGRLYPNLDELVGKGLVEKGQKDDRANEYVLTDAAVEMLDARRRWENKRVSN